MGRGGALSSALLSPPQPNKLTHSLTLTHKYACKPVSVCNPQCHVFCHMRDCPTLRRDHEHISHTCDNKVVLHMLRSFPDYVTSWNREPAQFQGRIWRTVAAAATTRAKITSICRVFFFHCSIRVRVRSPQHGIKTLFKKILN